MKDRVPTHAGRVKLTPVSGAANTYDMEMADSPTEVGTPLNKATLLTDATATKIGLTQSNPTVNDALSAIAPQIGDIKETVRTDLGNSWLLCNGEALDSTTYPDLATLLSKSAFIDDFSNRKQLTGEYFLDMCCHNGTYVALTRNSNYEGYISVITGNPLTGTWTTVTTQSISTNFRYFRRFGAVKYLNGYWVIIGGHNNNSYYQMSTQPYILYSSDAITWTAVQMASVSGFAISDMIYADGNYIATGHYYYDDGEDAYYYCTLFYASTISSTSWSMTTIYSGIQSAYAINTTPWVAYDGSYYYVQSNQETYAYRSTTLSGTFSSYNMGVATFLKPVKCNSKWFIPVGSTTSGTYKADDLGSTFTRVSTMYPTTLRTDGSALYGISGYYLIASADDGVTWQSISAAPGVAYYSLSNLTIASNGIVFIGMRYSTDGGDTYNAGIRRGGYAALLPTISPTGAYAYIRAK